MWEKVKKVMKYFWASPVTLFGLAYAATFHALGWYTWHGIRESALVWSVDGKKSPPWLMKLWRAWGGHAIGHVVVLKATPEEKPIVLVHELKHVDQCARLGVFWPLMYYLNFLVIKIGCPGSDPYYSNPFEIDARRAAGQIVDVEGTIKKITSISKKVTS